MRKIYGRKTTVFFCLLLVLFVVSGVVYSKIPEKELELNPLPEDFSREMDVVLEEINCSSYFIFALSSDLSNLDLSDRKDCVDKILFDTNTIWPDSLPSGFDPEKILEWGKKPGLKVQRLHERGITGKGVSIAILDNVLLPTHNEYAEQLVVLEDIHNPTARAHMHGTALTSIIAGNSTGIAPDVNIFFFATTNSELQHGKLVITAKYLADSIERILEWNEQLSEEDKIRVVACSAPWLPESDDRDRLLAALDKAEKSGIFFISINLFQTHEFFYHGLQLKPTWNRDNYKSYTPDSWEMWMQKTAHIEGLGDIYEQAFVENQDEILLIPNDSMTLAGPTGNSDYAFYRIGGWSWAPPYLTGLYALACQVKPDITPELFWETALETGHKKMIQRDGKSYIGKIVDPVKLIESLKK